MVEKRGVEKRGVPERKIESHLFVFTVLPPDSPRRRCYSPPKPVGPADLRARPEAQDPPRESFQVVCRANQVVGPVGPLHQNGALGPERRLTRTACRLRAPETRALSRCKLNVHRRGPLATRHVHLIRLIGACALIGRACVLIRDVLSGTGSVSGAGSIFSACGFFACGLFTCRSGGGASHSGWWLLTGGLSLQRLLTSTIAISSNCYLQHLLSSAFASPGNIRGGGPVPGHLASDLWQRPAFAAPGLHGAWPSRHSVSTAPAPLGAEALLARRLSLARCPRTGRPPLGPPPRCGLQARAGGALSRSCPTTAQTTRSPPAQTRRR